MCVWEGRLTHSLDCVARPRLHGASIAAAQRDLQGFRGLVNKVHEILRGTSLGETVAVGVVVRCCCWRPKEVQEADHQLRVIDRRHGKHVGSPQANSGEKGERRGEKTMPRKKNQINTPIQFN
jgi:hypothetical protein